MCKVFEELEKRGEKRGEIQGIEQGLEQMSKLIQVLLNDGRGDELLSATTNEAQRKALFREYGI